MTHPGAALGEQNPEHPCFRVGDVFCASLSPLARHLQVTHSCFDESGFLTFVQFRMYHLIFMCLF